MGRHEKVELCRTTTQACSLDSERPERHTYPRCSRINAMHAMEEEEEVKDRGLNHGTGGGMKAEEWKRCEHQGEDREKRKKKSEQRRMR